MFLAARPCIQNICQVQRAGVLTHRLHALRDPGVVQAVALVLAVFVVVVNLFTDVVHGLLDPRLTVGVQR